MMPETPATLMLETAGLAPARAPARTAADAAGKAASARRGPAETPGVTPACSGLDGVTWNILGQVYVPKQVTDDSFSWHATFPEETFVPPHVHPHQDEYIFVLDGRIDLLLAGKRSSAAAGDLVRMPRGIPHAFFNNSGEPVTALFWAAPAGKLVELYRRIHNMSSPAEVVKVAREYDVVFFPPVSSAA